MFAESSTREDGFPEEELLLGDGVLDLSSFHVLVDLRKTEEEGEKSVRDEGDERRVEKGTNLRNGDVEVETKTEDSPREEDDENRVGGVLEVGRLDLHTPKLDSPTDGRIGGRRFESKSLPVRRLDVLTSDEG